MGICESVEDRESYGRSKAIDNQLQEYHKKEANTIKLLLLGKWK